ncbi:MAG TPA: hypothetical protein VK154_14635 [Chitinophagales bacterium]|nr:hypothetical protein [Chitinophagales bacterium]
MSKVIYQTTNRSKALELKLEQEALNQYHILLTGITVNVANCVGGRCGDTSFSDSTTYIAQTFPDLNLATQVYNNYKNLYLD